MAILPHSRKLFLFAALSAADLVLTWLLLEGGGGRAYEGNPVASWWLAGWGWPGLVGFKVGMVVLAAALTVVVSRHHPRAGGRVLAFGCCAALAVVLYSGFLVRGLAVEADEMGQAQEEGGRLDRAVVQQGAYYAELGRLRQDLAAGRCTLAGAVEALAASERVQEAGWVTRMQGHYGDRPLPECLALRLMEEVLLYAGADPDRAGNLARELDAQYRSYFGHPPPHPAEQGEDSGTWRGAAAPGRSAVPDGRVPLGRPQGRRGSSAG